MQRHDADFEQKGFLKKRRFKISAKGVECYDKNGLEEWTYTVPFEEIIETPVERFVYSKLWLVLMIGSILFVVMDFIEYYLIEGVFHSSFLFWVGLGVIFSSVNFCGSFEKLVIYSLGRFQFALLKGKPTEESLQEFMNKVFEAQDQYFEEKYEANSFKNLSASTNLSIAEEIYKLSRLFQEGLIDEDEYNDGKRQILGRQKQPDRKIGF